MQVLPWRFRGVAALAAGGYDAGRYGGHRVGSTRIASIARPAVRASLSPLTAATLNDDPGARVSTAVGTAAARGEDVQRPSSFHGHVMLARTVRSGWRRRYRRIRGGAHPRRQGADTAPKAWASIAMPDRGRREPDGMTHALCRTRGGADQAVQISNDGAACCGRGLAAVTGVNVDSTDAHRRPRHVGCISRKSNYAARPSACEFAGGAV